jgi:hypothetical protein
MTEIEWAWAAGFFDGEGHCSFTGRHLILTISQVDRRPLDRFRAAVGDFGTIGGPYRLEKFPYYSFRAGVREVDIIIDLLWAYLSEPKREQIAFARAQREGHFPIKYTSLITEINEGLSNE